MINKHFPSLRMTFNQYYAHFYKDKRGPTAYFIKTESSRIRLHRCWERTKDKKTSGSWYVIEWT